MLARGQRERFDDHALGARLLGEVGGGEAAIDLVHHAGVGVGSEDVRRDADRGAVQASRDATDPRSARQALARRPAPGFFLTRPPLHAQRLLETREPKREQPVRFALRAAEGGHLLAQIVGLDLGVRSGRPQVSGVQCCLRH